MARRKASASELLFAAIIGMAVWTITPGDAFLMAGPQSVGVVGAGLGGSASGRLAAFTFAPPGRKGPAPPLRGKRGRLHGLRASAGLSEAQKDNNQAREKSAIPFRSETKAGYKSQSKSWNDFQYVLASKRREVARQRSQDMLARTLEKFGPIGKDESEVQALPQLHVVLIGGPCSGKGTVAPMLSQAFRCRVVGVGTLLRGEIRAKTARGTAAKAAMEKGELLDDHLVLSMVNERVSDSWDAQQNGWLLDGFPRNAVQAAALCSSELSESLRPDCVVVLERPDELVREFALGRMIDTATGHTYHPRFAPAPSEIRDRLVWRIDDTPEVIDKRIADYQATIAPILDVFAAQGIPVMRFDNARSELETFAEVADFLEESGRAKLVRSGWQVLLDYAEAVDEVVSEEADVAPICGEGEGEEECLIRYDEMWPEEQDKLVTAVQRCNSYNAKEYVPVVVGAEQVGWTPVRMISDLAHQLARGEAAELVLLKKDSREGEEAPADQRVALDIPGQSVAIRLAPYASNGQERCDTVQALVEDLLEDGVIPRKAVRNERQEVRPLYFGFGGPGAPPPLLQMERAAMVHFGCPVFAIHVNGYVRGDDGRIESVWIGQRSMSKATYPGLLDQVVAGGQPAGLSFLENVQKECEEEASLPPEVIATIEHTGVISYKYATRKGLSTKSIAVFDLEFPKGMSPICGDGEVEEFQLMRIEDALASIRHKLPLWKPNAALIMVDFALRHGFIGEDEPGYAEMTELLRRG